MKCGISTSCLYPMETKESLQTLTDMGFQEFEVLFNTFREIQSSYTLKMRKRLDDYGAVMRSIHPFTSGFESALIFTNYRTRFLDGLEFYKQYFEAANILGASILVLHGQNNCGRYGGIEEKDYLEKYLALYELGQQFGITVAQENVNGFRSANPSFIRRMREQLQNCCAFVFDVKQAVRAGFDPYDMCDAMGKNLIHVHINDNAPSQDCLLPGNGTMDYPRLLRQLKQQDYHGSFIIEVYRRNFEKLEELNSSAMYLNEKLSKYFG